jgi:hypothetical protein
MKTVMSRSKTNAWRRVPWPLWVIVAVQILAASRLELAVHGPLLARFIYALLNVAWLYFLVRGVRWVWFVTIAIFALGLAFEVVSASFHWLGTSIGAVELILLLLPVTRRYYAAAPTSLAK